MKPKTLFLALLLVSVLPVGAQVDLEALKIEAFDAIVSAEEAGADVSGLVDMFNSALALIEAGGPEDISDASDVLSDIVTDAGGLSAQATQQANFDAVVAVVKVALLVGLAVLVWMRGDVWFWRLWRRTKEGYVVQ